MMKCQVLGLLTSAFLLSSCGTVKSLDSTDNNVSIYHSQVKTNCEEISRIYSGVQYDWCLLDSERKNKPTQFQLDPLWVNTIDMVFSAVADTIVLPYTIYQQSEHGSLQVAR